MLSNNIKARAVMAALVILSALVSSVSCLAQNIDTAAIRALVGARKDSAKSRIRPYKEVVPASAKTSRGLFVIHKVDDRWLAEIPDSLLGRDMLVVNRIVRAPGGMTAIKLLGAGAMSYAGDEIGHNVIRFDKLTEDKVYLRSISFDERASDTSSNGLYRNLMNNIMQPIEAAFPIKAINEAGKSVVIDLTEFIGSDNAVLYFNPALKPWLSITGLAADRSFIDHIKAFPMNIEITTVRTYIGAPAPGGGGGGPRTYELNSSIVLLPGKPMQARPADDRVGFFAEDYVDFDANPQGIRKETNIWRWRMEPRPEDR
ncbi:MAG TPA: DUF5117 domain-containing protein, partial [Puia sp.]|nr:DUF5117 domain-containing protein [Puia sp.]